jgi:hypothetical protein
VSQKIPEARPPFRYITLSKRPPAAGSTTMRIFWCALSNENCSLAGRAATPATCTELALQGDDVGIVEEKHYKLVLSDQIGADDLELYANR